MIIQRASMFIALGLFAIATAQTPPLAVAHGQGVAVGANNRRGEFNFEVVKRAVPEAPPAVRGRFEFAIQSEVASQRVRIVMERAAGLGVEGVIGEFGGPAVMSRPGPNGPVRVHGRVAVRAEDLWNPTPTTPTPSAGTPRDKFAVRFFVPSNTAPNGQLVFEFAGEVRRGNLVVRGTPPTNP